MILEYAQEALESMAINASNTFGSGPMDGQNSKPASLSDMLHLSHQVENKVDKELVNRLKEELDSLKEDTKGSRNCWENAIRSIENKLDTSSKYLPPLVRSSRHHVVHRNCKNLVFSPSTTWKTQCGWYYYYLANYQFVEGDDSMVTCSKCLGSALRKEVSTAD